MLEARGKNRDFPPSSSHLWRSHMHTILYFGKTLHKVRTKNFFGCATLTENSANIRSFKIVTAPQIKIITSTIWRICGQTCRKFKNIFMWRCELKRLSPTGSVPHFSLRSNRNTGPQLCRTALIRSALESSEHCASNGGSNVGIRSFRAELVNFEFWDLAMNQ